MGGVGASARCGHAREAPHLAGARSDADPGHTRSGVTHTRRERPNHLSKPATMARRHQGANMAITHRLMTLRRFADPLRNRLNPVAPLFPDHLGSQPPLSHTALVPSVPVKLPFHTLQNKRARR